MFAEYGIPHRADSQEVKAKPIFDGGPTPRDIWITMGNAVRSLIPTYWVDQLIHTERRRGLHDIVLVTDVRYPNEVEAIRAAGGVYIRVIRECDKPSDPDGSDDQLDWCQPDHTINNRECDGGLSAVQSLYLFLARRSIIDIAYKDPESEAGETPRQAEGEEG